MNNKKQQSFFNLPALLNFESFIQLFRIVVLFLVTSFCFFKPVYADTGVTITEAKKSDINTYSGPSSAEKTGNTITVGELAKKPILEDAMNGRFLKVELKAGGDIWIKAKQVITTQVYDVGACEKQNKSSGTRAAVNCTE